MPHPPSRTKACRRRENAGSRGAGRRIDGDSEMVAAHAADYPSRAREYGPYLREFLESGSRVTPQGLAAAQKRRVELTAKFVALLDSVDAMAGPSGGDPAWAITHEIQAGSLPAYHAAWSAAAPRSAEFTMPMGQPMCRRSVCPVGSRRTESPTASSSRADDWVSRCSAASLMPMSMRRAGTTGTQTYKMMLEELQRRNYSRDTTRFYIRTVEDFSRRFT